MPRVQSSVYMFTDVPAEPLGTDRTVEKTPMRTLRNADTVPANLSTLPAAEPVGGQRGICQFCEPQGTGQTEKVV